MKEEIVERITYCCYIYFSIHHVASDSCIICAERESRSCKEDIAIREDEIDESLKKINKKRVAVPGDGHCLLTSWAKGFKKDKDFVIERLYNEVVYNQEFYLDFLINNNLEQLLHDYLVNRIYAQDDMDLLVNALCNAFYADAVIYQLQDNHILVNRYKPGRELGHQQIELFFHESHYELVIDIPNDVITISDTLSDITISPSPKKVKVGFSHSVNHVKVKRYIYTS